MDTWNSIEIESDGTIHMIPSIKTETHNIDDAKKCFCINYTFLIDNHATLVVHTDMIKSKHNMNPDDLPNTWPPDDADSAEGS
jgi:hypothetical protein